MAPEPGMHIREFMKTKQKPKHLALAPEETMQRCYCSHAQRWLGP
jgi:hypothetical protein